MKDPKKNEYDFRVHVVDELRDIKEKVVDHKIDIEKLKLWNRFFYSVGAIAVAMLGWLFKNKFY